MNRPETEKPLMTRGASWVLFVTVFLPAAATPIIVGLILLLESGTVNAVIGWALIVLGVVAMVLSSVSFIRKQSKA